MRAKFGVLEQTHGIRLRGKYRLNQFWTVALCGVASWQQFEKVEHGCTTTNIPLSNGIKIVSVLQRIHGEIGRRNYDVQKCDGQTDQETKNSTFLAAPAAGEIRAPRHLAW